MIVLDTDHISLLEWSNEGAGSLRERLADIPPQDVAVTIISFEEQMRGWMAYVAKARSSAQQVVSYRKLRSHLDNYRHIPVLDYDEEAAQQFEQLRRARIRIGTMDLKIAAIVLARDATLLSRNLVDFQKVPELAVEDWTR